MGWLGHYVADAAMPLHDSIHHDGWAGDNPKGYTRDPNIHGRFESSMWIWRKFPKPISRLMSVNRPSI